LESEKDDLLTKLKSLKIEDQHNNGIILLANNKAQKAETLGSIMGGSKQEKTPNTKNINLTPVDGYWITLQDWSQCNKKCDGGTSTFHRRCVPPKNRGKPCIGDPVVTKKCNLNPCPKTESNSSSNLFGANGNDGDETTVKEPIVKIMPFTDAPQRYTLCKIKESDLMIYEDGTDSNKKNDPLFKGKKIDDIGGLKLPCRVVMNPQTLTVFSGDKFDSLYMSFSLRKTRFYELINRKNCFKLYESSKKYITLCPYSAEVSSKELDEWRTDFEVFKTKCDRPQKNALSDAEKKALDNKIKQKMVNKSLKKYFTKCN